MTNPHALIIDDKTPNLEVLGGLLAAEGITYTAVKDPTKVSATLQELSQVDVVFCDLEMPKLDGYQVLTILRNHLGSSVPIIACTVHLFEINNAREIGFDGFLGKPLDSDRFSGQIQRILAGRSVWESA
jgi:CheY-like chemotaxis protein